MSSPPSAHARSSLAVWASSTSARALVRAQCKLRVVPAAWKRCIRRPRACARCQSHGAVLALLHKRTVLSWLCALRAQYTFRLRSNTQRAPVRVTLVWTDPAASPTAGTAPLHGLLPLGCANHCCPYAGLALVNDLDLKVAACASHPSFCLTCFRSFSLVHVRDVRTGAWRLQVSVSWDASRTYFGNNGGVILTVPICRR